ncbi:hypothetical protein [Pseudonocardia alaniniphila]|uniref:tRNA(Ile2) 2-agmatinylcytidine synthetase n=1 Tax=Pseudonocardia alaniniphila TaxID=75291 RepID=A0ABS9TM87_9PSEU|nr:hypothetical protein [Pseudonocardia alaniniphila]MCH6169647.1 hypothetical protein [Pseudonocardia alaniniphila]
MTSGRALLGVDLLIGIDDLASPGTGRRCRQLITELEEAGLGSAAGATRHQLLVDPRIPYTSHNSSACIAWRSMAADPEAVVPAVVEIAASFLERVCPPAADPGLAVAVLPDLPEGSGRRERLVEFGRRAKREVLVTATARTLAAATGVHLSGHGGTQDGVLGALAAVGLHLSGGDGLFLFMPGIREISGDMTAGRLLDLVSIDQVRDHQRQEPAAGELIELGDWVRPVLLDGRAVLLLEPPVVDPDGRRRWRTVPRSVVKNY